MICYLHYIKILQLSNQICLKQFGVQLQEKQNQEKILGQEERIGVLDTIKAVTINAAYQYFEENLKGSIKEGKIADLVILDKNPLNVEKDEIKDIKVVETIKSGKTIFKLLILLLIKIVI